MCPFFTFYLMTNAKEGIRKGIYHGRMNMNIDHAGLVYMISGNIKCYNKNLQLISKFDVFEKGSIR